MDYGVFFWEWRADKKYWCCKIYEQCSVWGKIDLKGNVIGGFSFKIHKWAIVDVSPMENDVDHTLHLPLIITLLYTHTFVPWNRVCRCLALKKHNNQNITINIYWGCLPFVKKEVVIATTSVSLLSKILLTTLEKKAYGLFEKFLLLAKNANCFTLRVTLSLR